VTFNDLFDFCRRIDLKKANKRTLEALIRAGAMDTMTGVHRASIMATLSEAVKAAEQQNRNQNAGMMDLFGDVVEATPNNQYFGCCNGQMTNGYKAKKIHWVCI
jgi:DNA polymerase-3 subunit alpha